MNGVAKSIIRTLTHSFIHTYIHLLYEYNNNNYNNNPIINNPLVFCSFNGVYYGGNFGIIMISQCYKI